MKTMIFPARIVWTTKTSRCGKIQSEHGKANHSFACKTKKMPVLAQADAYEECLFLYRKFSTEVLRLLVSATTMDSLSVKMESFVVVAFMLGMKEYFGNVDHLRATVSEVPVPAADYRKQYLVIYDSASPKSSNPKAAARPACFFCFSASAFLTIRFASSSEIYFAFCSLVVSKGSVLLPRSFK